MDWDTCKTQKVAQIMQPIEDVQSRVDGRREAIDLVGIRRLRHPIRICTASGVQTTIAEISLAVGLPEDRRGTHMSRFVSLLMSQNDPIDPSGISEFLAHVAKTLESVVSDVEFRFPLFVIKSAPVTGAQSYMDYNVHLGGHLERQKATDYLQVKVPVTSLCPCSKEISRYGAHNQRADITVRVEPANCMETEALIGLVEEHASAPLYGLLKRADEKFVTEAAYENPRFVEDTVREVSIALRKISSIKRFRVEVENYESIHNHSAWALIQS